MAGPTTDTLNDDIKELRIAFHAAQIAIRQDFHKSALDVKDEFKKAAVSQAELRTQLTLITRVAIWGITVMVGVLITSTLRGIWWASRITYRVDSLESRFDNFEASVDSRSEKLERSMERSSIKPNLSNLA